MLVLARSVVGRDAVNPDFLPDEDETVPAAAPLETVDDIRAFATTHFLPSLPAVVRAVPAVSRSLFYSSHVRAALRHE
jgi:hypothetical protein